MIQTEKIQVTTTGANGSASGSAVSARPLAGEVVALRVDWAATAPGGTSDIDVVCESDDDHPEITLYDKDNAATDVWVYPTIEETDTAGTGRSAYREIPISGHIKVSVAQCNALDPAVTVYVYVRA
jgi:hypothetical protein